MTAAVSTPARADAGEAWRLGRRFATGVAVVTAGARGEFRGCTVSAFCMLSREPTLISVSLRRDSAVLGLIRRHDRFTVNVLESGQSAVARHFASRLRGAGGDQFAGIDWVPWESGIPRLSNALCWLHCQPCARVTAGDHELVLARVVAQAQGADPVPLLYFAGALHPGAIEIEDDDDHST